MCPRCVCCGARAGGAGRMGGGRGAPCAARRQRRLGARQRGVGVDRHRSHRPQGHRGRQRRCARRARDRPGRRRRAVRPGGDRSLRSSAEREKLHCHRTYRRAAPRVRTSACRPWHHDAVGVERDGEAAIQQRARGESGGDADAERPARERPALPGQPELGALRHGRSLRRDARRRAAQNAGGRAPGAARSSRARAVRHLARSSRAVARARRAAVRATRAALRPERGAGWPLAMRAPQPVLWIDVEAEAVPIEFIDFAAAPRPRGLGWYGVAVAWLATVTTAAMIAISCRGTSSRTRVRVSLRSSRRRLRHRDASGDRIGFGARDVSAGRPRRGSRRVLASGRRAPALSPAGFAASTWPASAPPRPASARRRRLGRRSSRRSERPRGRRPANPPGSPRRLRGRAGPVQATAATSLPPRRRSPRPRAHRLPPVGPCVDGRHVARRAHSTRSAGRIRQAQVRRRRAPALDRAGCRSRALLSARRGTPSRPARG